MNVSCDVSQACHRDDLAEMVDINAVDDWKTSQPDVEQMDVHANRTKTCRMQLPATDKDVEMAESEDITWSGSGSDEGTALTEPVRAQSANLRILKLRINLMCGAAGFNGVSMSTMSCSYVH